MIAALATALALLAPAPTVLAAGDIASCRSTGDEQTAAPVARVPGRSRRADVVLPGHDHRY